jgi:hypothetical protein
MTETLAMGTERDDQVMSLVFEKLRRMTSQFHRKSPKDLWERKHGGGGQLMKQVISLSNLLREFGTNKEAMSEAFHLNLGLTLTELNLVRLLENLLSIAETSRPLIHPRTAHLTSSLDLYTLTKAIISRPDFF